MRSCLQLSTLHWSAKQRDLPQSIICVDCESEDTIHAGDTNYISESLTKLARQYVCGEMMPGISASSVSLERHGCMWRYLRTYFVARAHVDFFRGSVTVSGVATIVGGNRK